MASRTERPVVNDTLNETVVRVLTATAGEIDAAILRHALDSTPNDAVEHRISRSLLGAHSMFHFTMSNGTLVQAIVERNTTITNPVKKERARQANRLLAEVLAGYRPTEILVPPSVHQGFELKIPAGTEVTNVVNDKTTCLTRAITRTVKYVWHGECNSAIDYAGAAYGIDGKYQIKLTDAVLTANGLVPCDLFTLPVNNTR
jgi:hypothetical protein